MGQIHTLLPLRCSASGCNDNIVTNAFELNWFKSYEFQLKGEPAESCMCVLQKHSRVPLSLQHPVPVKRVVWQQRTFEILTENPKNPSTQMIADAWQLNLSSCALMPHLIPVYLDDESSDSHFLCCFFWVFHFLCGWRQSNNHPWPLIQTF